MVERLSILLLAGTWAATSHAQQSGDERRDDAFGGRASMGYLATRGNTESTNANVGFGLEYQATNWSHEFTGLAVRASRDEETTAEAYSAGYQARRAYGEHHYLFTELDWTRDRFSGYDQRISEAVGYGRRLIDTSRHVWNAQIGVGARQAEQRDGTESDVAILRAGTDYVWTLSGTSEFAQTIVLERGSDNTYLMSLSALKTRVVGDLALVVSYTLKRNSSVPVDSQETDTFAAISLEYAF